MAQAERRRIARLARLEKVRAIARQTAAREAAEAESTRAQLEGLARRTQGMVADYAARRDAGDGAALRQMNAFRIGLSGISAGASADALRARDLADIKQLHLAQAERRRQVVSDRREAAEADLGKSRQIPVLAARRKSGTGLE